jgi:hypothetical protein
MTREAAPDDAPTPGARWRSRAGSPLHRSIEVPLRQSIYLRRSSAYRRPSRPRRRAEALAASAALLLLAVSGCTAAPSPSPGETGTSPATTSHTPQATAAADADRATVVDGIGLAVLQNRPDYGIRRLQLSVTNEGAEAITVTAARFESPQFAAPVDWARSTEVPAGLTRFLPVDLPDAVCPAPDAVPRLTVTVTALDGSVREAAGRPADPFGVLPRIAGEDCLDAAVAAVASVRLDDALEVVGDGPEAVARLRLVVEPQKAGATTAASILQLETASSTILLQPADGPDWPLDLTLEPGDPPSTIVLEAVPARCDPHAIAEDKRGTFLPITLSLDDAAPATIDVPSSDALKLALYAFIASTCGFAVP